MCKLHTSFHKITNKPYVSSNYENTTKTVTADLTLMLRWTPQSQSTSKVAQTAILDKDTDRSNLNSKVK